MTDWIEELRRLDGVVTPGEWSVCTDATGDTFIASLTDSVETVCEFGTMPEDEGQAQLEADAALIALLGSASTRAAILAMADRVTALEAENARLRSNVRGWVKWHERCDADDDCTYLNDNAWCDAEALASTGINLLARAALTGGEDA